MGTPACGDSVGRDLRLFHARAHGTGLRADADALRFRLEVRDGACLAGQLEHEEAGVRAVDRVNVAAVVDLHVIDLDHRRAAGLFFLVRATGGRVGSLVRDEIANLARPVRVAHIDYADA